MYPNFIRKHSFVPTFITMPQNVSHFITNVPQFITWCSPFYNGFIENVPHYITFSIMSLSMFQFRSVQVPKRSDTITRQPGVFFWSGLGLVWTHGVSKYLYFTQFRPSSSVGIPQSKHLYERWAMHLPTRVARRFIYIHPTEYSQDHVLLLLIHSLPKDPRLPNLRQPAFTFRWRPL